MIILDLILIVSLACLLFFFSYNIFQENQQQKRLEMAFYQLLENQNSCVSLIQLSAIAKVDPELAEKYLSKQIKILSALPKVDDDGNMFYQFPKLHLQSDHHK
jgi:hypothetical protein